MISKLSAKYQFCAIRTADTRDGKLTTRGVYPWVVHELSIICPSFVHRLYPPSAGINDGLFRIRWTFSDSMEFTVCSIRCVYDRAELIPSTALTSDDLDTQMAPVHILLFVAVLFIYGRTVMLNLTGLNYFRHFPSSLP